LKSYDLTWLIHLVGDVHQPLHCVARITKGDPEGDKGGNDVKLTARAEARQAFILYGMVPLEVMDQLRMPLPFRRLCRQPMPSKPKK